MPLTPEENQELRRIHELSEFGELPETMQSRFRELRARDEHLEIPKATLDIQLLPRQRSRDDALDDAIEAGEASVEDMDEFDAEFADSRPYLVQGF
jgi:hypothetical protein